MGNRIEVTHFDENSNPCVGKLGYHKMCEKYDRYGRAVETTYYDMSDNEISKGSIIPLISLDVTGRDRIPVNSFIMKWNNWTIGDNIHDFNTELIKDQYRRKVIVYMTKEGEISELVVEKGLANLQIQHIFIETKQLIKIKEMYQNYLTMQNTIR